jgi:hypothetical protein
MNRITLARLCPGPETRRVIVILAIAVLCLTVAMVFAGAAFAGQPDVKTSAGMKAPSLDYKFVWWSFIITFGLLAVYYVVVLRISDKEFKKIVDAHFGPKQDGG